jgi:hypothetical protein
VYEAAARIGAFLQAYTAAQSDVDAASEAMDGTSAAALPLLQPLATAAAAACIRCRLGLRDLLSAVTPLTHDAVGPSSPSSADACDIRALIAHSFAPHLVSALFACLQDKDLVPLAALDPCFLGDTPLCSLWSCAEAAAAASTPRTLILLLGCIAGHEHASRSDRRRAFSLAAETILPRNSCFSAVAPAGAFDGDLLHWAGNVGLSTDQIISSLVAQAALDAASSGTAVDLTYARTLAERSMLPPERVNELLHPTIASSVAVAVSVTADSPSSIISAALDLAIALRDQSSLITAAEVVNALATAISATSDSETLASMAHHASAVIKSSADRQQFISTLPFDKLAALASQPCISTLLAAAAATTSIPLPLRLFLASLLVSAPMHPDQVDDAVDPNAVLASINPLAATALSSLRGLTATTSPSAGISAAAAAKKRATRSPLPQEAPLLAAIITPPQPSDAPILPDPAPLASSLFVDPIPILPIVAVRLSPTHRPHFAKAILAQTSILAESLASRADERVNLLASLPGLETAVDAALSKVRPGSVSKKSPGAVRRLQAAQEKALALQPSLEEIDRIRISLSIVLLLCGFEEAVSAIIAVSAALESLSGTGLLCSAHPNSKSRD